MHLSYYVPGRDEDTERDVDPMRLLVVEGRTYLEGWCRRAEAVRLFRLDRMLGAGGASTSPPRCPTTPSRSTSTPACSGPSPDDVRVMLELHAAGRWVADYYPCERSTELGEGRLRVILRTPDTRWVRGLALRLGEEGRVVAPAGLAVDIRAEAARALALYGYGSSERRHLAVAPSRSDSRRHGTGLDAIQRLGAEVPGVNPARRGGGRFGYRGRVAWVAVSVSLGFVGMAVLAWCAFKVWLAVRRFAP